MLKFTKARMAEELEIPLENIAFVPQRDFHIDMEMFITPEGVVVIHDEQKAVEFLEELQQTELLNADEEKLVEQCLDNARERSRQLGHIQKKSEEILQQLGMTFKTLPAIFESTVPKKGLELLQWHLFKKRMFRH